MKTEQMNEIILRLQRTGQYPSIARICREAGRARISAKQNQVRRRLMQQLGIEVQD